MIDYKYYQINISDDFKSDGCTFAPDFNHGHCCVIHDHARKDPDVSAKDADGMLYDCMVDTVSTVFWFNYVLAFIYWFAVRVQSKTGMGPMFQAAFFAMIFVVPILIYVHSLSSFPDT